MTPPTQFIRNYITERTKTRFQVIVTSYGCKKIMKKTTAEVLTFQKNYWLNKEQEWTMNGLGKPFQSNG